MTSSAEQFASPFVRRFNLVGMDMRAHGDTIGAVPAGFRRYHAAEDVYEFMVRYSDFEIHNNVHHHHRKL